MSIDMQRDKKDGISPRLAIVVPCYNEEAVLRHSVECLTGVIDELVAAGSVAADSFIYCVDDGSTDSTWPLISALHDENPARVHGHALAHNRGHQTALYSGLMAVRDDCDAAVSIDADMQDDPQAIPAMVEAMASGAEIVYGVRDKRDTDSWFKRTSARSFYRLQHAMGLETVYDHADYRLMSRRALGILSEYGETNLFLRGIVPQIGLKSAIVKYDRGSRVAGESHYPLSKMLSFSVDGITSFTARPIRLILYLGLLLLALDIGVVIYIAVSYFSGDYEPGWSSLMASIWFLGSIILISLGVIGEYIGKLFFEVKQRPRFNIRSRV